jgi:putative redox protein
MVDIHILYKGELRCEATHEPSGTLLITDAPKDNHGLAQSFSPTDLVATALGTCIMTVMGIAARNLHVDLTGTKVVVRKEMVSKPLRRIGTLFCNHRDSQ